MRWGFIALALWLGVLCRDYIAYDINSIVFDAIILIIITVLIYRCGTRRGEPPR